MPDDLLITNLRDLANAEHSDMTVADEAADEILRLREQIARAREMIADVDRYDCEYDSSFHDSSMEKRPDGDWVRSEDYDALASKHVGLHALIDDVEAQRDSYALKLSSLQDEHVAQANELAVALARQEDLQAERDGYASRLSAYQKLEAACREWSEVYDPSSMVDDPIIAALRELDAADAHEVEVDLDKDDEGRPIGSGKVLCADCLPPDYPTDETRCAPCPRRSVVETPVTICTCPHEGICEYGPQDPRCGRNERWFEAEPRGK